MVFNNTGELLSFLEEEDQTDLHLYRGLQKRYDVHKWKLGSEIREIEAVYPGDFRFFYGESEPAGQCASKEIAGEWQSG